MSMTFFTIKKEAMDVSIITIFVLCDEHLLELNITKMLALPSSISVSLTINKEYVELIQPKT